MSLNLSRKQKAMVLILLDSFFIFVSALLAYWLIQAYIGPPQMFFFVMVSVCIGSYIHTRAAKSLIREDRPLHKHL